MPLPISIAAEHTNPSEIRAMTRECTRVNGINMAQGICDLDIPACVVDGAKEALDNGPNTYTPCEGIAVLRDAICSQFDNRYGVSFDPESEIVISVGTTGAFYCACLALLNPCDEVILLEPYYGYHASTLLAVGCELKYVRLNPPDWALTYAMLETAVTKKTRAIMINTPANPSGKVFTSMELTMLADLAESHDLIVFTDEIYEHFVYDGLMHIPPVTIARLRNRTVTMSGFSKIFSITGWRLGYALCPAHIARAIAHMNDLVYACAPSPLQIGAACGVKLLTSEYYRAVALDHQKKRDQFCRALTDAGLTPILPKGSYYILADTSRIPGNNDRERALYILEKTGVASVPGRAFYHDDAGIALTRFCFAKRQPVLDEACERMRNLR